MCRQFSRNPRAQRVTPAGVARDLARNPTAGAVPWCVRSAPRFGRWQEAYHSKQEGGAASICRLCCGGGVQQAAERVAGATLTGQPGGRLTPGALLDLSWHRVTKSVTL